jgi:hypothetical protein
MSTFGPNKNIEMPASGSYDSTWATPVNADWLLIDTCFGGNTAISVTGVGAGTVVLSITQYQPPNIVFSGSITANLIYEVPGGVGGFWSVFNNATGAGSLTFSSGGGGSQLIPQGRRVFLICDGANMQYAQTGGAQSGPPTAFVALSPVVGTAATFMTSDSAPALNQAIAPSWSGVHNFNNSVLLNGITDITDRLNINAAALLDASAGSVLVPTLLASDSSDNAASTAFVKSIGYALLTSPALTGVPTAPTASLATATTQIATTAFAAGTLATGTNSGHVVLPNGLIIQWGISTFSSGAGSTVTFTGVSGCINFPNACLWAGCTAYSASATCFVSSFSASGITASNGIAGSNAWIAIGN